MEKKCPLFVAAVLGYSGTGEFNDSAEDCIEDECAWWDDGPMECAVLSILVREPLLEEIEVPEGGECVEEED
jgi:hypothetical protein